MKEDKEKWFDEMFESVQSQKKVVPRADLFHQIEEKTDSKVVSIIPMYQLRAIAAAVLLLLTINISALVRNMKQTDTNVVMNTETTSQEQSLITDYKLYQ